MLNRMKGTYKDTTPSRTKMAIMSAVIAVLSFLTSPTHAQLYADSQADFSGVQGQGGWYYGFYDGIPADVAYTSADFELLNAYGPLWFPSTGWTHSPIGSSWLTLVSWGQHPEGTAAGRLQRVEWAVRRWVSPLNGPIWIDLSASGADPNCLQGNGAICTLTIDGTVAWSQLVTQQDTTGFSVQIEQCISVGSILDFVVAPNGNNEACDSMRFTATIRGPIAVQPFSAASCISGSATFAVVPVVSGLFSYQWRFDATPIDSTANPSAATATLVLNNVSAAGVGSYNCIVSNLCGSVVSDPAVLMVFAGGSGDGDASGATDGDDIQGLVNALMNSVAPSAAYCAYDMNTDGVVDMNDVPLFVAILMS